jgi:hypothetical protein
MGQGFVAVSHWLQDTKLFSFIARLWHFLPQLPRKILNGLLKGWHSLPRFYHNLAINLVIGLAFTWFLLTFLNQYPLLTDPEDEGMDLAMQIRQNSIPPLGKNPHFVFLDIDDKTHQAWDEPLFTPRNRLKNLIDAAVKAEARLIVVDVGLSQITPIDGLGFTEELHPYDQQLSDYLANYVADCEKKLDKMACPPIILPRTFRASLPPQTAIDTDYFSVPPLSIPEERSSFLDQVTAGPYVQWASTKFFRSPDYVIRRWWLWQPTCTAQQSVGVIPSVELLAAAIIRNGTPQNAQEILTNVLSRFKPEKCPGNYVPPQPEQIQIGNLTVSTDTQGIRQRIMYSMPWLVNDEPPYLPHSLYTKEDRELPILTILSAQRYAESPPMADLSDLKNSIVVIGGSYSDGRDIHLTPLGNMPGPLILINAIHSLLQYEEIESISIGQKLLLQTVLIFLISVFSFLLTRSQWVCRFIQWTIRRLGFVALFIFGIFAGASSGTIVILLVLPFAVILLRYGIWLDFVIPLLLVQINQTMNDFNDLFEQCYNDVFKVK